MKFSQYLIENKAQRDSKILLEKSDLVLQQIVDAIDGGHIDSAEDSMSFSIGDLIGQPTLRALNMMIRKNAKGDKQVRLGQGKNGNYSIVIDTDKLPGRDGLDGFLSTTDMYTGFQNAYAKYMDSYHDRTKEYDSNVTQKQLEANSRDSFEDNYSKLIAAITAQSGKYNDSLSQLGDGSDLANPGKKHALELARKNLLSDFIGADEKDFMAKALKLPEAEFTNLLDKDWKGKLDSRLSGYYKSKYSTPVEE